ncbi:MAG: helicase C-terminal domain-containing protein [Bacillota bacterium]|nr:helicase C-terminal domain-containing protein [Bacillota bacterium]
MRGTLVFCDLETTGLDPLTDEIIEVGLVRVKDGLVEETWQSLVQPSRPISRRISSLTGLTDAALAGQPPWSAVRGAVRDFLGADPLAGHNIAFDHAFLGRLAGYRAEILYDTFDLARVVLPTAGSFRLGHLCRLLAVEQCDEHRALSDALAAARVFTALEERLQEAPPDLLARLWDILRRGLSPWARLVEDCLTAPRRVFGGAPAPGRAAGVRDEAASGREEPGPAAFAGNAAPDDPLEALSPGGVLARILPGYEYREGQLAMAAAVQEALLEELYLLVEAGTGTGKSLAYLVPAASWAMTRGQRVVVSTHTVNLQEQLLAKDIPLVRAALGRPLRAAVLKGRQHYLCRRRWEQACRDPAPGAEKALFLARLHVWLAETATGDRGELGLRPGERAFWAEIAAEREGCAGNACRYQASCFLRRARRQAEEAQVIAVNHALLLSEIQAESRVLPEYGPLIIDEAHHLEDVATEQLGVAISRQDWDLWLDGLRRAVGRVAEAWPGTVDVQVHASEAATRAAAEKFFAMLGGASASAEERESLLPPGGSGWPEDGLGDAYQELNNTAGALLAAVNRILEDIATRGSLTDEASEHLALQETRGRKLLDDLAFIFLGEDPDYVSWVARGPGEAVALRAAPVEAGRLLHEGLLAEKRPLIFTSATLTVEGSFAYFAGQVGVDRLPRHTVRTRRVASPFDYDRQALVLVVNDLPDPGADAGPVYLDALCGGLERLAAGAGGGTLVLFTSHKVLREAYGRLKPRLEALDIDLLGHGLDGSRARLLEAFKAGDRTVLFGTASFWEGVDLPGDTLRCLIIVKLPFTPPNHPVAATRARRLSAEGKNPFASLALPQAVIRFRQGFGRLIRTRRDRGVVVVLDRRVIEKRYGEKFLRSLPVARWEVEPLESACEKAARWLAGVERERHTGMASPIE